MRYAPCLGICFLLLSFSGEAWAQEKSAGEATKAFNDGVKYFNQGEFQKADDAFRRANELNPSWKIQYNIGQCEAALKRYGLAIQAFEKYLGEGGDDISAERRDEVLQELDKLRKMVGYLRVRADDGIDIFVDGAIHGTTPLNKAIMVTAGVEHWIWLVKDGEKLLTVNETVSGGDTLEVNAPGYVSEPAPPAQTAQEPLPEPQPQPKLESEPAPKLESAPVTEPQAGADKKRNLSPVLFWAGAGATVVFGGVTGVMAVLVNKKWKQIEDELDLADNDPWDGGDYDTGSLRKEARTMQIVGYVSMGLTGAALITTVVAIPFTDWGRSKRSDKTALRFGPWASSGGGGFVAAGRF